MRRSSSFPLTGNAAVVLGTLDYDHKIAILPEDKAFKKLKKNPTVSVQHETGLLL
jgi:hypothetical protein